MTLPEHHMDDDAALHLGDPLAEQRAMARSAAVVDCGHRLPEDALWRARPHLLRAGDCVAPRTLHEAVREGRRAAGLLC